MPGPPGWHLVYLAGTLVAAVAAVWTGSTVTGAVFRLLSRAGRQAAYSACQRSGRIGRHLLRAGTRPSLHHLE